MDRPGSYDAYNAALETGANIIDYGSTIASYTEGGAPFVVFFVINRSF